MIKFDKDVLNTLKLLEKAGFETYAAGECVRDHFLGLKVYDWDLYTRATLAEMRELLPEGEVFSESKQIYRMDFTYEVQSKDDEVVSIDGSILDIKHFDGAIEDLLQGMAFTMNAMADNPDRQFIDPFGGRDDIKAKLVKTTGDPQRIFAEKPVRMMEAVKLAAENDFDLHKSVFDAIGPNWKKLMNLVDTGDARIVKAVRTEFEEIVSSEHAGKGLKMLTGTGLMAVIWGEEIASKMSMSDSNAFKTVCNNIDKTKQVKDRRLGLVYTALKEKKALAAVERLQFDKKTKTHLIDGIKYNISINFLNTDMEFKKFLHQIGKERYMYLHNLAKAMRIVYDQPTTKVESRNYLLQKITLNKEPVFAEDLVIDTNDIMEAGITDNPERAKELLELVVALVHKNPANNNRDVLLKYAKKYQKSKLAAKMRYVKWVR